MPYKSIGQKQIEIQKWKHIGRDISNSKTLSCNSTDKQYVSFGNIIGDAIFNGCTISAWVKFPNLVAANNAGSGVLVSYADNNPATYRAWTLEAWTAGSNAPGLYFWLDDEVEGTWIYYQADIKFGADDAWHLVTAVYGGIATNSSCTFYLDGVEQITTIWDFAGVPSDITTIETEDSVLQFNKHTAYAENDTGGYADHRQGDTYFFPFACTSGEAQELYNKGSMIDLQLFSRWDDIKNHNDSLWASFNIPTTLVSSNGVIDLTNNNRKGSGVNFSADSSLSTDYPGSS